MKVSGLAAIAAIAAGSLAVAPVLAQTHVEEHHTTTVTTTHHEEHNGMDIHRDAHGKRKVCHTRWEHHHKVRHCTWHHW